jgi:hypothetical protein
MSLFMNNRLIVSKQYQSTFWLSKYRIVSILFRFCRLLELDSGKQVFGYIKSIFPVFACINSVTSIVCF